jgi:hypothetical protein
LEGRSENSLYPLQLGKISHKGTNTFTAFIGIKTTSLVCHFRLGHPSLEIVLRIILFLFLALISMKLLVVPPVNLAMEGNNLFKLQIV